jgi:hypothetical protein
MECQMKVNFTAMKPVAETNPANQDMRLQSMNYSRLSGSNSSNFIPLAADVRTDACASVLFYLALNSLTPIP